jgi:SAM-dependent methyltransferase
MSEKHFVEQKKHAEFYLIPYLERHLPGFRGFRVLEIGCAEAGFLDALRDRGIRASGLELEPGRISLARRLNPRLEIQAGDITDPGIVRKIGRTFDLIVMRDVIEHVSDREAAFRNLRALLKPGGFCYITFPPRFSPFAGHHQNGRTVLRRIPYLHLLPPSWIRLLGRMTNEHPHIIDGVVTNFRIGLSIRRFEALCESHGFGMRIKELYLLRPVYRTRMGLKPLRLPDIPFAREFLAFGCECLVEKTG